MSSIRGTRTPGRPSRFFGLAAAAAISCGNVILGCGSTTDAGVVMLRGKTGDGDSGGSNGSGEGGAAGTRSASSESGAPAAGGTTARGSAGAGGAARGSAGAGGAARGSAGAGGTTARGSAGAGGATAHGSAGAGGATAHGSAGAGGAGGTALSTGAGGSAGAAGAGGAHRGEPSIDDSGYISIDAGDYILVGYVSSFIGGSASSVALTSSKTSFCSAGTVGQNRTYQSWAGAGFAVNQSTSVSGGQVSPLLLSADSVTLWFSNSGGSALELQFTDSSNKYWCYRLNETSSPVTIPLSSFNTHCWDDSGESFESGTAIDNISLVVPGSSTADTPYSFCFEGLTINTARD